MKRPILCMLALGAVSCGGSESDTNAPANTATHNFSPNVWMWRSLHHSGRSFATFALIDEGSQPVALIVGRISPSRNVASEFFSFEVLTKGETVHLRSFGAFQPHANCIAGDFEFAINECPTDSEYESCASLIDLESGHDVKMYSFPNFNVSVPRDWTWQYSQDDTLGDELADHIDVGPMLERMKDKSYAEDRKRATSKFLRGSFNVRAGLEERLATPRISNRRCVDAGRDVLRALQGKDNHRFISVDLPEAQ